MFDVTPFSKLFLNYILLQKLTNVIKEDFFVLLVYVNVNLQDKITKTEHPRHNSIGRYGMHFQHEVQIKNNSLKEKN